MANFDEVMLDGEVKCVDRLREFINNVMIGRDRLMKATSVDDVENSLIEKVYSVISDEETKERNEKLRKFFLACADNADKISNLIGIDKIPF